MKRGERPIDHQAQSRALFAAVIIMAGIAACLAVIALYDFLL